jgi:hypothetical protein
MTKFLDYKSIFSRPTILPIIIIVVLVLTGVKP